MVLLMSKAQVEIEKTPSLKTVKKFLQSKQKKTVIANVLR